MIWANFFAKGKALVRGIQKELVPFEGERYDKIKTDIIPKLKRGELVTFDTNLN